MSKGKTLIIGLLVIVLGLGGIFTVYQKRNAVVAVNGAEETAPTPIYEAAGPEAQDVVYEASNGIMPGLYIGEGYLAKDNLTHNEDGTVTYLGETWKRNTYMHAILCLGVDQHANMATVQVGERTGTSDGMFLIAQDTAHDLIKVVMIPRDSMLEMELMNGDWSTYYGFSHIKFAFSNGDRRESSAESSVKAVEDLLCGLEIDHYIAGDLGLLAEVNDLVGGVTVTIPSSELTKVNPDWTQGTEVTLHGDEAERFIRYRDTSIVGTALERMNQHKAYITGFYKAIKVSSQKDSSLVIKLCDTVEDSIVSDMSKGEYERLALDGLKCGFNTDSDILSLPGEMTFGEEDGEILDQFYIDYEQTIPILLDLFYRKVS